MLLHRSLAVLPLGLVAGVVLPARTLAAQGLWLDARIKENVSLELLKPNFAGPDQTTLATSTAFLSVRVSAGAALSVVGELPFAHFGQSVSPGVTAIPSENLMGNPYLGLEVSPAGTPFGFEVGVRLPVTGTSDQTARAVGVLSDVDRAEAFAGTLLGTYAAVAAIPSFSYRNDAGFTVVVRAGPSLLVSTSGGQDSELFAVYRVRLGYQSAMVDLGGGVTGRMVLTESGLDFGERTLHQLGAGITVGRGRIRPGLQLRVPLDRDLTEAVDYVLGLHLSVALR